MHNADQSSRFILDQLLQLLQTHGITIREEPLGDARGGLCRIGARQILLFNKLSPPGERAKLCARVLHQIIDLDTVYLRPEVRSFLEEHCPGD